MKLPVKVNRKVPSQALQPFTDYFKGFEKVEAVRKVFGDETEAVLSRLKIGFIANRRMYMGIRDDDGNIAVGTYHLRHSTTRILYLDIVHELFHIKQWMRDKEWFTAEHEKFMGNMSRYYVSPLEVPAYVHTVREAERLGMTTAEITKYLEMMPVTPKIWNGFLKEMGLKVAAAEQHSPLQARPHVSERLPVKVNRNAKLVLLPFTDYFKGFEEAPPIKALFGEGAKTSLQDVKVEFLESPFGSIFLSDDDDDNRHLVVNSSFVKEADLESIYLDVILSLNVLRRTMTAVEAGQESLGPGFVESPLVLESYKAMVEEARRIGMPDSKVIERLQFPRFMMTDSAFRKLVRSLGLELER